MVKLLDLINEGRIVEVRFHGRGGQGAVTAANILVVISYKNGLWGQAFPFFGAERRGAPVTAFARIGRGRVRRRSMIKSPDIVVILDDRLPKLVNVLSGLKKGGYILVNTGSMELARELSLGGNYKVFFINATEIALKHKLVLAGWPLVNTAVVGALSKILGFPLSTVENSILDYLGERRGRLNVLAARDAYMGVRSIE